MPSTRSSTSTSEGQPARSSPSSAIPVSVACTWASTKAGVTSAPSRSTTGRARATSPRRVGARPGDRVAVDQQGRRGRVGGGVDLAPAQQHAGHGAPLARQPGLEEPAHPGAAAQQVEGVRRVAGDVAVADEHRHVGGQPLGAERGGGERGGHREEDDGAAVGGRQDRAVLAAGHVDADHGDVGRAAGRGDRLGEGDRVAGVGERDLVGEAGAREQARASASIGTTPIVRGRARRPRGRQRQRAGLAGAADHGDDAGQAASYAATTRAVSAGAPQTSITARASSAGRSSGSTAAMERPNRIGVAVAGTCSLRPSQRAARPRCAAGSGSARPGWRRGRPAAGRAGTRADLLDGADQHAAGAGHRVLHLAALGDDLQHLGADAPSPSPPCACSSWRKDAASRLSRSTRMRTSSAPELGAGVEPRAACGSTPGGSRTRCRPTGEVGHGHPSSPAQAPASTPKSLRRNPSRAGNLPAYRCGYTQVLPYPPVRHRSRTEEPTMTVAHVPCSPHRRPPGPPASRTRTARPLVEPDWTRFPGWRDVTAEEWALRAVAARPLREERQAAARRPRRPGRRAVLRRPRARPGASAPPCRCWCRRR